MYPEFPFSIVQALQLVSHERREGTGVTDAKKYPVVPGKSQRKKCPLLYCHVCLYHQIIDRAGSFIPAAFPPALNTEKGRSVMNPFAFLWPYQQISLPSLNETAPILKHLNHHQINL